ncbi:two-component system phosphate regulon sensor histidine kinase PhoR [Palleronia aestuarii]|uniref:histidine kinase n=1 Tax=Palleronia aestuarii TaxID=568105 RepID=A0A2W7NB58_9RHOB|nr:ATP-binding protein [Palleronia aestuarii]PZX17561.1 two-component system phosphate regulon sensor histidine kinase PhoR [Palleronia aestuarii]
MPDTVRAEILDALPFPALLIGRDERIEAANGGAARLLGPNLAGRHYVTGLRQPAILDAIEAVRRDGKARGVAYLDREGSRDTTWRAHVAPSGQSLLVSFEDRTAAEEAGQMRRDFVANLSHELRTPLTAFLGFIETLRGAARDDAAARDRFLETMEREAQRMNRLVSDLLSLSRVEAQARIRPTEPIDLGGLVTSVIGMLTPVADEAGAVILFTPPENVRSVPGDADQLRQVFGNLIENAIKYGGETITVTMTPHDDLPEFRGPGMQIDVSDDGPGIDELHLPRLTERFYRVDTHRSRAVGGTGLGLAIVKHIINRHRGRLRMASAPGRGSCFSILLPMSPP